MIKPERASVALAPTDIKLAKPLGLDPKRTKCFNKPTTYQYFDMYEPNWVKKIPPENRYNMDKKAAKPGGGKKAGAVKFIVPCGCPPRYRKRSANVELITIIECVSADGSSLEPGFVFSGKEFHKGWFKKLRHTSKLGIGTSSNGWTDDFIGLEWFTKCFIPQVKACNTSKEAILLLVDGHGSHQTKEWTEEAKKENIHILCLPPHTTHRLQPLDVGVLGPLETSWANYCDAYVEANGQEMPKPIFVHEYLKVREKCISDGLIKSAWKHSGAWPVNRDVFTDKDFALSIPYSTSSNAAIGPLLSCPMDSPVRPAALAHLMAARQRRLGDTDVDGGSDDSSSDNDSDSDGSNYKTLSSLCSEDESILEEAQYVRDPVREQSQPLHHDHDQHSPSLRTMDSSLAGSLAMGAAIPVAPWTGRPRFLLTTPPGAKWSKRRCRETYKETASYVGQLLDERDYYASQAVLARQEAAESNAKANLRLKPAKKSKTMVSEARWLVVGDGQNQVATSKAARKEKEEKQRLAKENRLLKEADRLRRRRNGSKVMFQKLLSQMLLEELRDVADALSLPKEGLRKPQLTSSIKAYFAQHPEKKDNEQFCGLFSKRAQRLPATDAAQLDQMMSADHSSTDQMPPSRQFLHLGPSTVSGSSARPHVAYPYIPGPTAPIPSQPSYGWPPYPYPYNPLYTPQPPN